MTGAMVCAVCARPLNLFTPTGTWIHATPDVDDHPPVPVAPADVPPVSRCDICYGEPVAARLPVAPFEFAEGYMSDEAWILCAPCQALIDHGRWARLTRRAARAIAGHLTRMRDQHTADIDGPIDLAAITAQLTVLLTQLRANITGPIQPL
jgi:hypothetical protein